MEPNAIIREIRNENHLVFKKLFEDRYEELVKYAYGYLYDMGSSEDVVQEVFVYIWEKCDDIEIKTTLKAYLYAMVRNRCLNVLKAIKVTDTTGFLELQTAIVHTEYDFTSFSLEDKKPLHQEVLRIVESLPMKMRTIVKMRFIENYRYAEIAAELGISINTVKTQLKRAKARFGELIVTMAFLLSHLK